MDVPMYLLSSFIMRVCDYGLVSDPEIVALR